MEKETKVLVSVKEIEVINKFILHLMEVDDLLVVTQDNLEFRANHTPEKYFSHDVAEITEEDIHDAAKSAFKSRFDDFEVPMAAYEYITENIDRKFISRLEKGIMEWAAESKALADNPLGYHGMSERDFI